MAERTVLVFGRGIGSLAAALLKEKLGDRARDREIVHVLTLGHRSTAYRQQRPASIFARPYSNFPSKSSSARRVLTALGVEPRSSRSPVTR